MAFSSTKRTIYLACQLTVVLLVGMHLFTAAKGYRYFVDVVEKEGPSRQVTYKMYETRLIVAMIASSLTFFTNIAGILLLFKPERIKLLLHIVVSNLAIEASMGIVFALSIYEMSITRDFYFYVYKDWDLLNHEWDQNGFNLFWKLLIADGILTFVPQIAGLTYVYLGVSSQVAKHDKSDILTSEHSYN